MVKAALAGAPMPYQPEELKYLAGYCTEKEDDAEKVERRLRKSAAALLLESRIGQRFEAIVTGASDRGTWVRLLEPPVEGRMVTGATGLDVGDSVRVELISTDVDRGFIDFVRV
jgi:exoribonuclease-2